VVGSGLIELIIGLILIYFLFSLLTSGVNEVAEHFLHRRAKYLESGIVDLLGPWAARFFGHPLVQALHPEQGRPTRIPPPGAPRPNPPKFGPSYIPSRTFSMTLLSLVADPSTQLKADIPAHTRGDTLQIQLVSDLGFPAKGQFTARIGSELFHVASAGANLWFATAAVGGTAPSEHKAGAEVVGVRSDPPSSNDLLADLNRNLDSVPDEKLRESLRTFLTNANQDLEKWTTDLEEWFDDKMDRVSGWYKRKTKVLLLIWGLIIVGVFNADTVVFARALYTDSTLRASVATAAQSIVQAVPSPAAASPATSPSGTALSPTPCPVSTPGQASVPPTGTLQCVANEVSVIRDLGLPMGWNSSGPGWPRGGAGIPLKIAGLLITSAALTLGAPFWFDLLNKFINFRASGQPPPKAKEPEK